MNLCKFKMYTVETQALFVNRERESESNSNKKARKSYKKDLKRLKR